ARFFREVDRRTGFRTRSLCAAPICDGDGAVLGVVQLVNSKRGAFAEPDEALLRRLCAEAAVAIESTSLYGQIRGEAQKTRGYNRIVGSSPAMARVYALVQKASATEATVLLRGESGTGKELIARAIHFNSARREQ